MKTMKVVIKNVGEPITIKEVPNCYETLKDAVGGWIEAVRLEKGVTCWINEEGKLIGLKHNFNLGRISIEGNAIFTGETPGGNNKSLTEEQIEYVKSLLSQRPTMYQRYIDTFFREKDLPTDVWTFRVSKAGEAFFIRQIDSLSVIAFLRSIPDVGTQQAIRRKLTELDFRNGDILDFLKFIAQQMFERNM